MFYQALRGLHDVLSLNSQLQVAGGDTQVPDGVEIARETLALVNPGDDEYLSKLDTLARELLSRFALTGNPDDLDEAIVLTKQFLDMAPPGHSSHLGALSNMGQVLTKRFKFRGDASDLTQAISYFEAAVEACTPEESFYLPLVANLSSGLLNRYRRYGDVTDLDRIVKNSSFALSTCPADSPNQDTLFNNWATALKERFEKQGNRNDLDTALIYYQSCLDLRPPGHPLRHTVLGNLADAMLFRFEVDGHLQDLESAADHFVSALQLCSPGQEGFLSYLTSLGIVFLRLFNGQGDTEKMDMAIGCFQTAMVHSTVPNLDHSRLLDNYGAALQFRHTLSGNVDDLDQAIQYLTTSSDITPTTYSGRHITLFNLGTVLLDRFNATSNIADLDSCIEKFASALQLCGPGNQQRPTMLSLYGCALTARFRAKGDIQDLDLAVSTCKDALALSSPRELNYSSIVANLSLTLYECFFYKSGKTEEIQAIIDYCDRALVSIQPVHPAFITLKIVRANAFFQKCLHERRETDISTSIDALRGITATLPEGHAEYVPVQMQLALGLETRFQLRADTNDLDESISVYRVAHRHCERGNTNYIHVCMQLGNALRGRFEYYNDSGDALDEAIVLLAEVEGILSATPGHSDYKASLVNLGIALFMRFQAQRGRGDLDAAIEHLSCALALPASTEGYLVSFALATFLSARYSENRNQDDLERSVKLFGSAAEEMPPKHLARVNLCRNYGSALFKLGNHRDRLQYLDAAIVFYKEALEYLPASHYDQPLTYMRLAEALYPRALLLGDLDGLMDVDKLVRGVMQGVPKDSPNFQSVSHQAAGLSMTMYMDSEFHIPSFMEDGFRCYEQAASYTHHHGYMSVVAALEWAEYAEKYNHSSALLAYQACLGGLNQHLLSTASIKNRRAALLDEHWVRDTGTLATDATACAIARGELGLAVELSEQGRGLLWSQMAQSRTPLDALRSASDAGRALASDFERVSTKLAQSTFVQPEAVTAASRLATEEAARRYRQLTKELDDIVARIRQQDGFQSFLDRPSFQSLQRAALGGPVILVNVSRQRCDALIVLHDAPPRLVPLDTTLEDLTTLSTELYHMLKMTSRVGEEKTRERQLAVILRTLWDAVVRPVVDELTGFLPRGARIWWCPTSKLTSLPLHAAGPYRKGESNLANMYISSYTPTLAALIRARQRPSSSESTPPALVAIGQAKPSSSTAPELQTVDAELTLVQSLLPPTMPFSALPSEASTADAALTALRTHAWAHLACHGHPNVEQPFDSSFALSDRAVTVLDVVRAHTDTTTPEFAFLSACHTAVGDAHAPDEIIHLAAAMQFAGFKSVIGTMWAVDDGMAREMVRAFYTHMFAGGWDCTQAARAMNKASKSVDKQIVTIDQRIVFIHIGA